MTHVATRHRNVVDVPRAAGPGLSKMPVQLPEHVAR